MLNRADLFLFHAVNGLCGNWALDRIVYYEEGHQFLKGGIMMAAFWGFWFARPQDRRRSNRETIVAVLIGVFAALVISRVLAAALPFRARPMITAGIGYHAPSLSIPTNLENWSSFPSDMAAYFFALSFGLYALSRWVGVLCFVGTTIWICLPRLYLGIHYPSDLIAGAAIGIACVRTSVTRIARKPHIAALIMKPLAAAEAAYPAAFYAVAFAVCFEMAMIFDDIRDLVRVALHGVRMAGWATAREELVMLWGGGAVLAIVAGACWIMILVRRSRHRPPVWPGAVPGNDAGIGRSSGR